METGLLVQILHHSQVGIYHGSQLTLLSATGLEHYWAHGAVSSGEWRSRALWCQSAHSGNDRFAWPTSKRVTRKIGCHDRI
jgi:hypothetical protein